MLLILKKTARTFSIRLAWQYFKMAISASIVPLAYLAYPEEIVQTLSVSFDMPMSSVSDSVGWPP